MKLFIFSLLSFLDFSPIESKIKKNFISIANKGKIATEIFAGNGEGFGKWRNNYLGYFYYPTNDYINNIGITNNIQLKKIKAFENSSNFSFGWNPFPYLRISANFNQTKFRIYNVNLYRFIVPHELDYLHYFSTQIYSFNDIRYFRFKKKLSPISTYGVSLEFYFGSVLGSLFNIKNRWLSFDPYLKWEIGFGSNQVRSIMRNSIGFGFKFMIFGGGFLHFEIYSSNWKKTYSYKDEFASSGYKFGIGIQLF